ncbi:MULTISPECIES: hypothetical protein [Collinsella]|uniref:hypothetical protein n=1 Tax=Collinsella TaxID=102106 RepID=UPI001C247C93|nr:MULTISPECIES: hypothetical protein [Collinsella]MBU8999440.1 hypothetical protein [Collinsella aerofaciens]MBU9062415.1 hypothetical protein [Collinsella sp. MSK.8.10]MCB5367530.1 hypothetical protein [Collinsella aerofaciens]
MGLFNQLTGKPKANAQQSTEQPPMNVPFAIWMLARDSLYIHSYSAFQDVLATHQPFIPFSVKLKRQTKRNMPQNWEVENGAAVILDESGVLLGTVSAEKMEKHGFMFNRTYRAFSMPPCRDYARGFTISDSYSICVAPYGAYI